MTITMQLNEQFCLILSLDRLVMKGGGGTTTRAGEGVAVRSGGGEGGAATSAGRGRGWEVWRGIRVREFGGVVLGGQVNAPS